MNIKKIINQVILILISFLCLFPIFWMITSSFKSEGEIFNPNLIPKDFTFLNYTKAFDSLPIIKMLGNSLIIAFLSCFSQLLVGVLIAYAFVRYDFKLKKFLTVFFSICWIIPTQVIMIPNFLTISNMGLQNNLLGIILPTTFSLFAILNLISAFRSFPSSIIESARLDGSSDGEILWKMIIPNLKSYIISIGVLLFITIWNEYLWAILVVNKIENMPIQVGLRSFVGSDDNQWGSLMAATTISCIPIFMIYLAVQRKIMSSFMMSGMK